MNGLQYEALAGLIDAGVLVPTCATHDGLPDYLLELVDEHDGDGCAPIFVVAPEHVDVTVGPPRLKVVDG